MSSTYDFPGRELESTTAAQSVVVPNKVRQALVDTRGALEALKFAVEASGKLNDRGYIPLGIQVNNALDKAGAALAASHECSSAANTERLLVECPTCMRRWNPGEHCELNTCSLRPASAATGDAWPPLKEALWRVLMAENLNDGHYIKAFDLIEKLHSAAVTATEPQTSRETIIEECANIADDHTPAKHEGTLAAHVTGSTIAKAIRALSMTRPTLGRDGGDK